MEKLYTYTYFYTSSYNQILNILLNLWDSIKSLKFLKKCTKKYIGNVKISFI
jgi:hypothetical protein